jgi:ribosome-associated protein
VIANGTSERMLESLSQYVREEIKVETGLSPVIESGGQSGWIVLDYGYVVVHLLSPEMREYYDLEGLWNKAKVVLSVQ